MNSCDGYGSGRGGGSAFPLDPSHCPTAMTLEDKLKAGAKDAEGRLQEAAGAISGNDQMKAEGEAKQLQAQLIDAAGSVKDKAQQVAASIGDALDGLTGKGG